MKNRLISLLILIPFLTIVIAVLSVSTRMVSSGKKYLADTATLKKLHAAEVRIKGKQRFFGSAWTENRGGLTVIHLQGTPYEMGYQHGILLK